MASIVHLRFVIRRPRMRLVLATALLACLASPGVADDKKEASKDAASDEPARCLIVRAADKDVTPPVEVDYSSKFKAKTKLAMSPVTARTLCKSESNKPASEWVRDHGACDGSKVTWKYTVTFGKPGSEEKFEQNVICAKKQ
jgi:hypothetical protein